MSDDNECVGYRSPPKHSRFKPGQSGNPAGRPPRLNSFDIDLQAALSEDTVVRENGAERVVSKQRALIDTLISSALAGDMRAISALFSYRARGPSSQTPQPPEPSSDHDDNEMIDRFKRRQRQASASNSAQASKGK